MTAKTRKREITTARQVAMYLARTLTNSSLPKIGEEFGGRDHTTVMHANDKITEELKSNPEIEEAVKAISQNIKSYLPGSGP
jgi:chromosomal replication initiator protein